MGIDEVRDGAKLVDEAIVIGKGWNKMGYCSNHPVKDTHGQVGGISIKETSKENIGSAGVGERVGGKGEEEAAVGLGKASGVTESMDDAAEVEGIRAVATEAKAVKEANCLINIGLGCA